MEDSYNIVQYKVVGMDDAGVWLDNGEHLSKAELIFKYNSVIDYLAAMMENCFDKSANEK